MWSANAHLSHCDLIITLKSSCVTFFLCLTLNKNLYIISRTPVVISCGELSHIKESQIAFFFTYKLETCLCKI